MLEWFRHDADLSRWQAQVGGKSARQRAAASAGGGAGPPSSAPNSGSGRGSGGRGSGSAGAGVSGGRDDGGGGGGGGESSFDARGMDFVIDEMALACQVSEGEGGSRREEAPGQCDGS